MPTFNYHAKNVEGKEKEGTLTAKSKHNLAKLLQNKGYFLISAETKGARQEKGKKVTIRNIIKKIAEFFRKLQGVSLSEKLLFTRNLEIMVRTGVPLPKAFKILSQQAKSKKFENALRKVSKRITKGENLSEVLKDFPSIFSNLYVETLKVGEEIGQLENSLNTLASQMKRTHDLKDNIKSAMVYPVMVFIITIVIGIVMMIMAVPKLKEAFKEMDVELPFTTQVILSISDFMVNQWPMALGILICLVIFLVFLFKSKKTRRFRATLGIKIPFVKKIVKKTNSTLVLRTLSSLLGAGVPIVCALEVTSGAISNFYFRQSLKKVGKKVKKGEKLSSTLKPYSNLYSPMVIQMLKVGEETGETPEVLNKLANFYEEQVESTIENLSSVVEPVLILLIGGVVGFFAFSMMKPMFSIMGSI